MTAYNYLSNLERWHSHFLSSTIKGMLLTSAYTFDGNDVYVSDLLAHEVSDASYSRVTISNKTRSVNIAQKKISFSADNPNFGMLDNLTATWFIVYEEVTNDLDSFLLGAFQFVPSITMTGAQNFVITLGSEGFWSEYG